MDVTKKKMCRYGSKSYTSRRHMNEAPSLFFIRSSRTSIAMNEKWTIIPFEWKNSDCTFHRMSSVQHHNVPFVACPVLVDYSVWMEDIKLLIRCSNYLAQKQVNPHVFPKIHDRTIDQTKPIKASCPKPIGVGYMNHFSPFYSIEVNSHLL